MISLYDFRYYSIVILTDTYFVRYLNDHKIPERIGVRFSSKCLIPDILRPEFCPEYCSSQNIGKKYCPINWIWLCNGHLYFIVCRLPHKIIPLLHAASYNCVAEVMQHPHIPARSWCFAEKGGGCCEGAVGYCPVYRTHVRLSYSQKAIRQSYGSQKT